MSWTNVNKPTNASWTRQTFSGMYEWDDSSVYYDDPNVYWDGINTTAYTNVAKPTGSTWSNVAKPT